MIANGNLTIFNSNKNYFNGNTSSSYSYYGATSTTYSNGVYIYFENNNDGKSMYFMDGSTKKYVSIVVSGTYRNFNIDTSTPTNPWYYDETNNSLYTYTGNTTKYYLGLKVNTTYTTFGAFSESNIGTYMYVEDLTADVFSYKFLNNITCDSTGNTAPVYAAGYGWNNFKSLYNSYNSVEKNLLTSSSVHPNGTNIEKAMARYDIIAHKYGLENFISRSSANSMRIVPINNSFQINVILIISLVAISGAAVYLIIRKKKAK